MKHALEAAAGAAALALAVLVTPFAASAQGAPPSYAVPGRPAQPARPSGAVPSYASPSSEQSVHGVVVNFDGKYALQVRDRRGYLDNVRLHQGTIINPTGLPLRNGERVAVYGYNAGRAFAANEIDVDVPPVVWAPYPYPRVGLRFGFWGRW